jgi:hypothetical protein
MASFTILKSKLGRTSLVVFCGRRCNEWPIQSHNNAKWLHWIYYY